MNNKRRKLIDDILTRMTSRGMSIGHLAEACGVTSYDIHQVFDGGRDPDPQLLAKINETLIGTSRASIKEADEAGRRVANDT